MKFVISKLIGLKSWQALLVGHVFLCICRFRPALLTATFLSFMAALI